MIVPRPYQNESIDALTAGFARGQLALVDGSDTGCHAAGTQVLMFNGTVKRVEDVAVGDSIMGWDSTPRVVLALNRGHGEMVRVSPIKGGPFEVNLDHVLTLQRTNTTNRSNLNGGVVDATVREYLGWLPTYKHLYKLFRVPIRCWKTSGQPIPPYLLGVLLGDGSLGLHCRSSINITKPGDTMLRAAEELAGVFGGDVRTDCRSEGNPTHHLRGCPALPDALDGLGLLGLRGDRKFVPLPYKVASWDDRASVLAGLLDTDGSLSCGGYDFISVSRQLAEDAAFLARSLGLAAYLKPCKKSCQGGFTGDYWRVSVSGDCSFLPCRLKPSPARKQIKSVLRTGFSVEPLPDADFYGFTLSGDGRFCLGDFTVTHNTGKTIVACEVVKRTDAPTLVVCPRSVRPSWARTAAAVGTELDTINWEMVRTGNTPYGGWRIPKGRLNPRFYWNDAVRLLIFDEAHRAQGFQTKNSEMVKAARRQGIRCMLLSATLAEDPMDMDALGYVLRWHDGDDKPTLNNMDPLHFLQWASKHGCGRGFHPKEYVFKGSEEQRSAIMLALNKKLYPAHGVRVRIADLGDEFPETQLTAELFETDDPARMDALYNEMASALEELEQRKALDKGDHPLTRLKRAHQEIELLKVPVFVEQAKDMEADGLHVAIFVNHRATLLEIAKRLNTDCIIDGSQVGVAGALRREENRLRFQRDESPFILCTIEAGGVGLDLHDVRGFFPRGSLISPSYKAKDIRQVRGRVWRWGALSKSIQRIILAAGTVEEDIFGNMNGKLDNLDALNDGDLRPAKLKPVPLTFS